MVVDLERIASTTDFIEAKKTEQAAILIWAQAINLSGSVSLSELSDTFHRLGLSRPNPTRMRQQLSRSKSIRTVSKDQFLPQRALTLDCQQNFSDAITKLADLDTVQLQCPPFLKDGVFAGLQNMAEFYGLLYLLENSMRGFIEDRLLMNLGENWWDQIASSSMKQKHDTRTDKETKNKWAPARSDFGPLYSIDWPDLLTIIRKRHDDFKDKLPDISFLHRYEDLGHYRNIVAHNGILKDPKAIDRIKLYYSDWIKQIS
ncbi:hypothetical protein AL073_00560 [Loktanella sp. 1ANDIMAR09]|nr:hypothetical protein AL073_00560 [Loktanella sp. 1ANDIMAR09]